MWSIQALEHAECAPDVHFLDEHRAIGFLEHFRAWGFNLDALESNLRMSLSSRFIRSVIFGRWRDEECERLDGGGSGAGMMVKTTSARMARHRSSVEHRGPFTSTWFDVPGRADGHSHRFRKTLAPPVTRPWGRTPVLAGVDGVSWETSVWRDKDDVWGRPMTVDVQSAIIIN